MNFFVLSFSKKTAVNIARIVSVKGRFDPSVEGSVYYVSSSGQTVSGGDINSDYWDCVKTPRQVVKASSRRPGTVEVSGGGVEASPGGGAKSAIGTGARN